MHPLQNECLFSDSNWGSKSKSKHMGQMKF